MHLSKLMLMLLALVLTLEAPASAQSRGGAADRHFEQCVAVQDEAICRCVRDNTIAAADRANAEARAAGRPPGRGDGGRVYLDAREQAQIDCVTEAAIVDDWASGIQTLGRVAIIVDTKLRIVENLNASNEILLYASSIDDPAVAENVGLVLDLFGEKWVPDHCSFRFNADVCACIKDHTIRSSKQDLSRLRSEDWDVTIFKYSDFNKAANGSAVEFTCQGR